MKKTYLIAGASKGIGNTLYHHLKQVDRVISFSRTDIPGASEHFQIDVLQDTLPAVDGPIDGLVYCPGTINLKQFPSLRNTDFLHDFEVNVVGAVKVIRHYLANLKGSGNASVVLFSSVAATKGMPYHASVAAAKGAIEGLTRSLAAEFAPGIRFNAIAPSLSDTTLAEKLLRTESQRQASAARHPMKRIGTPEDISHAALYLLSEDSSWITGQVLHIDGGLSTLA